MRVWILILVPLLAGCSLNARELERWTLHWEQETGVPPHGISFVRGETNPWPEYCGMSGVSTVPPGFDAPAYWISYDLGCWWLSEKELALHEVCHQRMKHLEVVLHEDEEIDYEMKENEVALCVWAYLEDR